MVIGYHHMVGLYVFGGAQNFTCKWKKIIQNFSGAGMFNLRVTFQRPAQLRATLQLCGGRRQL